MMEASSQLLESCIEEKGAKGEAYWELALIYLCYHLLDVSRQPHAAMSALPGWADM